LPVTTIAVQRPSLLKASQAWSNPNGFKRITTNQRSLFSQLTLNSMSRKTWPKVTRCFDMTGYDARQPDATKRPSSIWTDQW